MFAQSPLKGVYPIHPNANNENFNDLAAFKKQIAGARIVFIGDMIHGESNIDSARIYIIKMLVEEMGFDVLAFESGIYDLYKAELLQKEGMDISTAVKESVFPIWTGFDSFLPLLNYLESKKGKVMTLGFDPQRSGSFAFEVGDDLAAFLTKCGVEYDASVIEDWDLICDDLSDFTLPEDFNKLYFALISKKLNSYIKFAAQSSAFAEEASIWKQIVESKKQMVSIYTQKGFLNSDATTFKAKDSNLRDKSMAENLQFYLDLYPDKKIICWGASGHFAKSTHEIENAELKDYKPMGSYIKEKYGDKAVVIGATGYKGQYGWEESLHNIPKAAENSFENLIHQTGYKTALVDLSQIKNKMPLLSSAFVEGGYQISGHWNKVFDWFLFVYEVYPKTAESFDKEAQENIAEETSGDSTQGFDFALPEDAYKMFVMSRKGEPISGKVIDKRKNPIPFSAVGLKGKSYGTISDENGIFTLLIPGMNKKDSLAFSNVAYEAKVMAVADLRSPDSEVILEEKTLALPEVIISSKTNTAEGIMLKAIEKIEENYYQGPFSFKILYHTIKKDTASEKIFSIDWTALNYFDKGYQSERRYGAKGFFSGEGSRIGTYALNKTKIQRYTSYSPNIREFGGIILYDYIKFRKFNFLNKRNIKHYNFAIAEIFQKNGNTLCKIDFKSKTTNAKTTQYSFYKDFAGFIIINLDDYAIIKISTEALIDKEKILKNPKWNFENLDKTWVTRKEVDYKKIGDYYFIDKT